MRLARAASREPGPAAARGGQRAARPAGPVTRLRTVPGEAYADWDVVYRANIGWVYRLMFGRVGNRPDAEDLTAEVFMAVLRPLRLPASVGEVRGYLLATCRTVLASYWARTLGQQVTTLADDPAEVISEAHPESAAPQRAEQILAALPERYRRILQLRVLDACTVAEAARALDVSVANAKVLQHRALRRAAEIAAEME